jgi:uncharacterized Zn-binding protein involved in type VI secretion
MAGLIVTAGATALCPHGGSVSIITSNTRVMLGGQPAATSADSFLITGCAFTVGPKAQPCIKVQWLVPAVRVKVNGQPVVLQNSTGLCLSAEQIPQGPPNIVATQPRVNGT